MRYIYEMEIDHVQCSSYFPFHMLLRGVSILIAKTSEDLSKFREEAELKLVTEFLYLWSRLYNSR